MPANIKWSGDIKRFKRFLNHPSFSRILEKEVRKATARNAAMYQEAIIKRIRGNHKSKKHNSKLTMLIKGSSTPLVDSNDMWKAVEAKLINSFNADVGFLRNQKGSHGMRMRYKDLIRNLEDGFTVKITAKMRRWLWLKLRKKGLALPSSGVKSATSGIGVIKVPGRPFITPVFKSGRMEKKAQRNWNRAVRIALKRMKAL